MPACLAPKLTCPLLKQRILLSFINTTSSGACPLPLPLPVTARSLGHEYRASDLLRKPCFFHAADAVLKNQNPKPSQWSSSSSTLPQRNSLCASATGASTRRLSDGSSSPATPLPLMLQVGEGKCILCRFSAQLVLLRRRLPSQALPYGT